jgi:hypothetical protein
MSNPNRVFEHDSKPGTVGELLDNLPAVSTPVQPPAVRSSAAVTPMQMLQIAVERGADMAMLEKLMSLQERWEANEARKAYVAAMSEFKSEALSLAKNKHVAFGNTKYDHATLDQVCDTVGPALSRYGLSHRWDIEQAEHDVIRVSCVLTHALGHSERVTLSAKPDTSGQKNAIQAIGSAITYLQRYTLLAATGLTAKEQDDDGKRGDKGGAISAEQKETLVALMKATDADVKKFLGYMGIAALDELPASRFANAKAALEKKKGTKS